MTIKSTKVMLKCCLDSEWLQLSYPVSSESKDDMTYYYATINVEAISYIVKQRNWKLPQLSFNQVEDIISRLRTNKSPDIMGFSPNI